MLILYFGSVVAAVRLGEVGSLVVRVLFIVSTKVLEAGWRETQIGKGFPPLRTLPSDRPQKQRYDDDDGMDEAVSSACNFHHDAPASSCSTRKVFFERHPSTQ